MSDAPAPVDEPRYRIGAVCRLTGISQHVLRVWEKRYGAVRPERSETHRRLYRDSDVNRLSLLKLLVDRGQAIGSIAGLDDEALERRAQQSAGLQTGAGRQPPRLVLIGGSLALSAEDCAASDAFDLIGHYDDVSDSPADKPDIAVIEWPGLSPDSMLELTRLANRLGAAHTVLVYDFAQRKALRHINRERFTALRSPLDIPALEAVTACRFGIDTRDSTDPAAPPPSRQYSDRELVHLAAQSPAIECECPMHLAQLISRLVRFENYSAECESRNADDAALHAYLHNTTSQARHLMEQALQRVIEAEGLSLQADN